MLAFISVAVTAIAASADSTPRQPGAYAFVNVSVIPMDRERILEGQTVVVEGDRIVALGPSSRVKVPEGAVRIDGAGKFLIPGLAEMHAHIPPGPAVPDTTIERVLALFALNGVTTVRGMLGDPRHLPLRERAARNEILSPTIYTSSPSLNGGSMKTGAEAADSVTKYRHQGYDLLKIHPGIRRGVFDTIAATAHRVGIPFAGHVPLEVGIEHAIASGYQTVDHFDGVVEGLVPDQRIFTQQEAGFFGVGLIDRADEKRIKLLADRAAARNVWVVPTETLMRYIFGTYTADELRSWPEMKYWSKAGVQQWVNATGNWRSGITPEAGARYVEIRRKIIKTFHAAGVPFLLGSDAPQVWNVPGFSTIRELGFIVDAGLTPYQALESGTLNVAKYTRTEATTGTVAVGKRADLILLDGNPLRDIGNVGKQAGVMVRGRWLPAAEIAQRLATMEAR